MFREVPTAFGHVRLKTWDEWADEYVRRSWETGGNLEEAIQRAERDGFRPRRLVNQHNAVEDAGFGLLLSFLSGSTVSGLEYVALGTSSTPPTGVETELPDEQIRLPISTLTLSGNQLTAIGYFDTTQANVLLGSAALFGNGANDTPNSGTIYSYVVYSQFTKNSLESLTAQWTLGFQRPAS